MPTFTFVGKDQEGKPVSGTRSAASRQDLSTRLKAENITLVTLNEETMAAPPRPVAAALADLRDTFLVGKVKQADLMVFARQLSAMLKAGVSLTDALQTIAHGASNDRLRNVLLTIRTDVQRGRTLTDSLKKHSSIFDPLFVSIVHAGESSGSLAQNVARLADYLARKEAFRRKVKAATAYPKFVIGFFVLMAAGIFLFLIPRFKAIFEGFGAKLPFLTRILFDISVLIKSNIILIVIVIVLGFLGLSVLRKTHRGRAFLDRTVLRIPFFGMLLLQAAVARMAMTLGTLLSNGIPLTDALQISTATLDNSLLEKGIVSVRQDVVKGRSLAESLSRQTDFPRLLARMVHVGEESGTLAGMLMDVANYYDQEVDSALSRITAVIEPVLIVGMGVMVLITVLAIYLPIFSLSQAIRGGI
jgi:type IV pilus assembly protein PilC